jgi:hypothetical protein
MSSSVAGGASARIPSHVEPVASGDRVALELAALPVEHVADPRPRAVDVVQRGDRGLEKQRPVVGEARGDQVLDDLLLGVGPDRAADEALHVEVVGPLGGAQVDAAVADALPLETVADAVLAEQVHRALLEQSGAYPLLDVLAAAALQHDGLDALHVQEMGQHQPGGPGTDDSDLGSQGGRVPPFVRTAAGYWRGSCLTARLSKLD